MTTTPMNKDFIVFDTEHLPQVIRTKADLQKERQVGAAKAKTLRKNKKRLENKKKGAFYDRPNS